MKKIIIIYLKIQIIDISKMNIIFISFSRNFPFYKKSSKDKISKIKELEEVVVFIT